MTRKTKLISIVSILIFTGLILAVFNDSIRAKMFFFYPLRPSEPSTVGLIGYWPLDGNALDKSGNGNNGTLNDANASGLSTPVAGKVNTALQFDGMDDYVQASDSASLQITGGQLSLSAWVKLNALPTVNANIVTKFMSAAGGSDSYALYLNSSGQFQFTVQKDTDANQSSDIYPSWTTTNTFSTGQWYHVAAVWQANSYNVNDAKIYVNGVSEAVTLAANGYTTGFTISYYANPLRIGEFASRYTNGSIDDVRIYNRALSEAEIKAYYDATSGGHYIDASPSQNTNLIGSVTNGLVGYWAFEGPDLNWATGKLIDRSGQNNTGGLINMSTSTTPAVGVLGQGLQFDGVDDNITISDNNSLDAGTNSSTFSAWVKLSIVATEPMLITHGIAGTAPIRYLAVETDGTILSAIEDNSGNQVTSTNDGATVNDSVWHHLVVVFDRTNNQMRRYKDGFQTGTINSLSPLVTSSDTTQPLYIGALSNGVTLQAFFNGSIDDVRVYNRALSADEIWQLYTLGGQKIIKDSSNASSNSSFSNGLVGYWTFDGPDVNWRTGQMVDKSGQGNTGGLINMSTSTTPALGISGSAFEFDGVNDIVSIGDVLQSTFSGGTTKFTTSVWFKLNQIKTWTVVFGKSLGSAGPYEWGMTIPSGILKAFVCSDSPCNNYVQKESSTAVSVNQWYLYTLVFDGSASGNDKVKAYLNGIELTTVTTGGTLGTATADTAQEVAIGSSAGANQNINSTSGTLDDVRIYNRALSSGEVWDLYKAGARE